MSKVLTVKVFFKDDEDPHYLNRVAEKMHEVMEDECSCGGDLEKPCNFDIMTTRIETIDDED